jgi:hypothetical protein
MGFKNNKKSRGKSIPATPWILKISRKKSMNQKPQDFCQIFVISNTNSKG